MKNYRRAIVQRIKKTKYISKSRYEFIDFARAIVILQFVSAHVGFNSPMEISYVLVPIFFITAGYLFSGFTRTFWESLKTNFVKFLIPFYGLTLFYGILEIFRFNYLGYGNYESIIMSFIKALWGAGYIPLYPELLIDQIYNFPRYDDPSTSLFEYNLPSSTNLWFLMVMFTGQVIFHLTVVKTQNRPLLRFLVVIALVMFSCIEQVFPEVRQLPLGLGRATLAAAWMHVGLFLNQKQILTTKVSPLKTIILMLIGAGLVILCNYYDTHGEALANSKYGPLGIYNVILTFLGGVGCSVFVLELCKVIIAQPISSIKHVLNTIGKRTMVVYSFHFVFCFILTALYLAVTGKAPLLDPETVAMVSFDNWEFCIPCTLLTTLLCVYVSIIADKAVKNFPNAWWSKVFCVCVNFRKS